MCARYADAFIHLSITIWTFRLYYFSLLTSFSARCCICSFSFGSFISFFFVFCALTCVCFTIVTENRLQMFSLFSQWISIETVTSNEFCGDNLFTPLFSIHSIFFPFCSFPFEIMNFRESIWNQFDIQPHSKWMALELAFKMWTCVYLLERKQWYRCFERHH